MKAVRITEENCHKADQYAGERTRHNLTKAINELLELGLKAYKEGARVKAKD